MMKLKRVVAPKNTNSESKMKNIKVEKIIDGIKTTFDSIIEYEFYEHCNKFKNELGIKEIIMKHKYLILDGYEIDGIYTEKKKLLVKIGRRKREYTLKNGINKVRPINYIADYIFIMNDGTEYVIDVKGLETTDFKLKRKIFESKYNKKLVTINNSVIKDGQFYNFLINKHGKGNNVL